MNGSQSVELGAVPEQGDGGHLLRWAEVKKAMRAARKRILKDFNLNEDSLKRLEEDAALEFFTSNQDEVETEHGVIYFSYHPAFLHKNSTEYGGSRRIHLRDK